VKNASRLLSAAAIVALCAGCPAESTTPAHNASDVPAGSVAGAADTDAGTLENPLDSALTVDVVDKRVADIKASFEAQNAHDAQAVAAFYSKDALVKAPGMPDWKGRDVIMAEQVKSFEESPDVKWGPRRIIVADDVAIVEWTATGTAITNKKTGARAYGANGVSIMWFGKDGKVKEEHDILNAPTVIAQTGAAKGKIREVLLQPSGTPDVRSADGNPDEAKNADLCKGFDRALEAHDDKTWPEIFADDVVWDDYSMPAPITGKADVTRVFSAVSTALPDQKIACKTWAASDIVVKECLRTATHEGPLPLGSLKIPATHRFVQTHFIDILQMKGYRIQKGSRYADNLEMANELGLVGPDKDPAKPTPKKKKP